jgi:hypothetical protein
MFYGAGNLAAFPFQVEPFRFASSFGLPTNSHCHRRRYVANRWSAKPIWRSASAVPHKLKVFFNRKYIIKKILTSETTQIAPSLGDSFVVQVLRFSE